jgi:membrane fusion protein (multidrug efflux system)
MYTFTRALRLAAALLLCTHAVGAAPPPTQVFVAEARLDQFVDRVEALGTLRANESVSLTVSVTETVTALHFDDGERVAAGQVLAEMTSNEEHAQLEEARATVAEAWRQYQRVKSLAAQGTASKSLLDERHREWETGRARLAAIESRLADRLIRAPFAGVVGLRNVSIGALMEPGDLITTLDDDSVMKLDFAVPSTYLGTLEPGLEIEATTRAYPERTFRGQVKSIDSRVDPATRAIAVRAILPNADGVLKPGMLMQVELFKNPREAVVIPEEALLPRGEQQTVLVVDEAQGNRTEQRELRIGARRAGEVEVLAGLAPGEKVITDGTLKVRPGEPVAIRAVDDGAQPLHGLLESQAQGTPAE